MSPSWPAPAPARDRTPRAGRDPPRTRGQGPRTSLGVAHGAVDVLLLQVQVVSEAYHIIPGRRGAEVLAGARLDPIEEVELQVVGLLDLIAGGRGNLAVVHGFDQVGGHQHDELLLGPLGG